jgi:hypothetical protein
MTPRAEEWEERGESPGDQLPGDGPPSPAEPYRSLASGELSSSWELGEFFQALGPLMQLPPRGKGRKGVGPSALGPKSPPRRGILVAAVLLLAAVMLQAPLLLMLNHEEAVREEVLGAWRTRDPRYAERGFVITRDSLCLIQGAATSSSYPVTGMRSTRAADSVVYIIHYRDGGLPLELGLHVAPDSTVLVANLPGVVWRKEGR